MEVYVSVGCIHDHIRDYEMMDANCTGFIACALRMKSHFCKTVTVARRTTSNGRKAPKIQIFINFPILSLTGCPYLLVGMLTQTQVERGSVRV